MPISLFLNKKGNVELRGFTGDFARYEKDITSGKIPCPFKVEFLDTYYSLRKRVGFNAQNRPIYHYPTIKEGRTIHRKPIPLKPSGQPKIPLFQE